ncbi:MAG: DUF1704 domain-containing protein [Deltaproteobacteria bacterium]|nr:DUF1704 domain-containing protein [Deltaproteobacteria bacterium]
MLPLAARRHGTPASLLPDGTPIRELALEWLAEAVPTADEHALVPLERASGLLRNLARRLGLEIEVRIEPGLAALAAAGDRALFLSAGAYRPRQLVRLAAHELLGHLTSAFNGRAQRLRLLEHGTAGSYEDQEGLCLWLERGAGALDANRRRTLALRVEAAQLLHTGATFGEACMSLRDRCGLTAEELVRAVERSYRAGGAAARDPGYLLGLARVDDLARVQGSEAVLGLRAGRISVAAARQLGPLRDCGFVRAPILAPSIDALAELRGELGLPAAAPSS